jgi:cell division protein FtsI (penicillin-binding protein 3)
MPLPNQVLVLAALTLAGGVALVGANAAHLVPNLIGSASATTETAVSGVAADVIIASRPEIIDRHGVEMAIDIRRPSLYAEPGRISDVDGTIDQLRALMPELDSVWLRTRLSGKAQFVWIKRSLSADLGQRIKELNLPGLGFLTESQRLYPKGVEAAHVLGAVNIDNQGTMGVEKYLDDEGLALLQNVGLARGNDLTPVTLSIDSRVQHLMYQELSDAMSRYKAIAAAGALMDVHTGEVIALVSLPGFDPNAPASIFEDFNGERDQRYNRITAGSFELGSTFKTITIAGALEERATSLTSVVDATKPITFGRFSIDDFNGEHRLMTMPEVFKYSSNIGTIRVMQAMGKENFRAFLTRMGFDETVRIELPEVRPPSVPKIFSDVGAATASFGHGLSVSPMHMLRAMAALVNGGMLINPTLFPRTETEALRSATRVVTAETSERIRYLLRLNALEGSGTIMNSLAEGFDVGGKTGTAEKVVGKSYAPDKTLAVFTSAFPMKSPRYAMIILVDEPQAETLGAGVTAGWNAGAVTGRLIRQVAPVLNIESEFNVTADRQINSASTGSM